MKWADLHELQQWSQARWPGSSFPDDAITAIHDDLPAEATSDDLWTFCNTYLDHQPDWPPKPAQVITGVKEATRRRLRHQPPVGLPAPRDQLFTQQEWLEHHGFEGWEAAMRHYAPTLFPWEESAGVPVDLGGRSLVKGPGRWSVLSWIETE